MLSRASAVVWRGNRTEREIHSLLICLSVKFDVGVGSQHWNTYLMKIQLQRAVTFLTCIPRVENESHEM